MATPTQPRAHHPRRPGVPRAGRVPARQPLPAGKVIVVMLVAALVGGLLNAAGIRKTANGQPVGIRRDIARFLAEPLYDVSHALRIDQIRRGLQAITGRSGADEILTRIPDPTITDADVDPTEVPPAPPPKRAFSPANPVRVWIGGDSLAITPGQSFVNLAAGTQVIAVPGGTVDGHVATGLARPEVFNWPAYLQGVVARDQPDAVVLTLGSNDDQSLTGEGAVGPFGSPEWIAEYRRRVGGTMDAITANGRTVLFWMGTPVMRNEQRSFDRYAIINDIYAEEARKRPGRVVYIDVFDRFLDADGRYSDFLDGVQVRTPDGVHFTRAGGDRVAQAVLDAMHRVFDLTSWRQTPTITTVPPAASAPGARTTSTSRPRPARTG